MDEVQIFNNADFGEVRMAEIEGKAYACGADVARVLGYSNTREAISRHCRCVAKRDIGVRTGIKSDGTPAIQQVEMLFIPEGDVIRLVARSKLPAAERFESWVFDEVIPSVLRTGTYTTPQAALPRRSDWGGLSEAELECICEVIYTRVLEKVAEQIKIMGERMIEEITAMISDFEIARKVDVYEIVWAELAIEREKQKKKGGRRKKGEDAEETAGMADVAENNPANSSANAFITLSPPGVRPVLGLRAAALSLK
ncbi:MAG: hypothetical protein LBU36_01120 [Clostridiales bacterium]|jgi:prophage antirepressor-like protein|nr:hypothetical protein [Clostridiales bacterium]